jgi:hypothetical protein
MLHPPHFKDVRAAFFTPTQFITALTNLYVSMDITMVDDFDTADAPSCAVSSAPSQSLFDAVDDLSQLYLTDRWTGSILFRCILVSRMTMGVPLDQSLVQEIDICDYLGYANTDRTVCRLYLDPHKYNQPPLPGESIAKHPQWMLLKVALESAAHLSGSPIMCNGGKLDNRTFQCKLRNRIYRTYSSKIDCPSRQDDCINQDKGGRRAGGRSLSKRTRTTQALTKSDICPFRFTVKWDFYGFYITVEKINFGCSNHENHIKGDLSKLSLPIQLLPKNEQEILKSMAEACIGSAVGRNYVFSKLGKYITKAQIAYFTSEPTVPLADGVKKSDTDSLLEFFEATEEISYHTLWDVPLTCGSTALVSSLNVDRTVGFAEIDHTYDPDFVVPRESAKICRQNPRVPANARIFIAVAWANKYDIRTFL